ncbi:MAG: Yip1 family protein [Halioglobus sp.]|nr:Yip1 family protein [Halioglobus sp.]
MSDDKNTGNDTSGADNPTPPGEAGQGESPPAGGGGTQPQPGSTGEPGQGSSGSASGFDLGTVIAQMQQVLTDPTGFYRAMPREGGYSEPIIFALVMGAISGAVFAVLSIVGLTGAGVAGLAAIIWMPVAMFIGSFIGGAIMFVIWKLMGSPRDFQAAYRCVAYSYGVMPVLAIVSIIPYVGTIVRVVWGLWLMLIASVEVHERARQTALIVLGIIGVVLLITGLSGERASRQLAATGQQSAAEVQKSLQSLQQLGVDEQGQIDPEKAGRALGDFMRGMQEAAEGTQQQEAAEGTQQQEQQSE